jgi:hypothetical protein
MSLRAVCSCVACAVVSALGALAMGCAGASGPASAATVAAADTSAVQSRLVSGPWRLLDYRPDVPLEPMLQAMLAAQVQTMVVRFDGQTLSAQSPTLQITRPYHLDSVSGPVFDVVSPDMQGGGELRTHCEVSDDGRRIFFRAQTDPWTGTGVLAREGP